MTTLALVIAACCVLHIIFGAKGEKFPLGLRAEVELLPTEFEQPDTKAIKRT